MFRVRFTAQREQAPSPQVRGVSEGSKSWFFGLLCRLSGLCDGLLDPLTTMTMQKLPQAAIF